MAVKMIHQKNTIFLFALISFLIIPDVRSKRTFFFSLILKKMASVFILQSKHIAKMERYIMKDIKRVV